MIHKTYKRYGGRYPKTYILLKCALLPVWNESRVIAKYQMCGFYWVEKALEKNTCGSTIKFIYSILIYIIIILSMLNFVRLILKASRKGLGFKTCLLITVITDQSESTQYWNFWCACNDCNSASKDWGSISVSVKVTLTVQIANKSDDCMSHTDIRVVGKGSWKDREVGKNQVEKSRSKLERSF